MVAKKYRKFQQNSVKKPMKLEIFIRERLQADFTPESLDVVNESAKHRGHVGDDGTGQTHFAVRLVSSAFTGQTRVVRQRAVHAALREAFARGLHALSLTLLTPEEARRQ